MDRFGPKFAGVTPEAAAARVAELSEIVEHLEAKGLERMKDAKDRRRSLIWLSDAGFEGLERDRDVLSRDLLLRATRSMTESERSALVAAMLSLLEADDRSRATPTLPTHTTRRRPR